MKLYENLTELRDLLKSESVSSVAFQGLDLTTIEREMLAIDWQDCLFLGCKMSPSLMLHLYEHNHIFPSLDVPYKTYPQSLYETIAQCTAQRFLYLSRCFLRV